ncbi:MAG: ABC transporter substrate-binding protein [Aeromicrobium erythreum]
MSLKTVRLLVAGLVAALALTACGSSESDDSADGGWQYTSGSGDTISLDQKPKRIIASAQEASALIAYGIKPVGIYLSQPVKTEPSLKGVDLSGIEIIGTTWGKIDAEKAAALKPDLIVADYWPPEKAYSGFEESVSAESKKVAKLAPIIGAKQQGSLEDIVEWYDGFAESLGVDTDEGKAEASKKRYEEAKERFSKTVAAKEGLSVMAVSPADDILYVAVPKYSTSLTDFKEWGLDVIEPDSPKKDFPYWEYLSWEKADKYQPDLLLVDDRDYAGSLKTAERQPTWDDIKAAKAKAVTPWPGFWVHTYDQYASQLDQLTVAVSKANADLSS